MSGPGDMSDLLGHLEQLQRQVANAQNMLQSEEVEGSSGGGAVRIRVSGELNFSQVSIDDAVVAQGDARVLEDLVLAALRDAATKLTSAREEVIGSTVGGMMGALFAGVADDGTELDTGEIGNIGTYLPDLNDGGK